MTHWSDAMTWLNPPPHAGRQGNALAVTTAPDTDFWRETFYGYTTDNGHFLRCPATGDFTAGVEFSGSYAALYDQAGLMLRAGPEHWVKAGVEMTDGIRQLSVVVTNGRSDWSQMPMPGLGAALGLRLTRQGDAIRVQYRDSAGHWVPVRLAYFPPGLAVDIGPMCCSPRGPGFAVRFDSFSLGPPISRDLHPA